MGPSSDKTIAHGNLKNRAVFAARNFWSGLLFGLGFMAFATVTAFHQLLQWHHFYDLSDKETGIFSDGILNMLAWTCAIAGLALLISLQKRKALWPRRWTGAAMMGAGIYLLFDGIVIHKLLKMHQIRQVDDLLPYDITWLAGGTAFLLTGLFLVVQTRKENHRK